MRYFHGTEWSCQLEKRREEIALSLPERLPQRCSGRRSAAVVGCVHDSKQSRAVVARVCTRTGIAMLAVVRLDSIGYSVEK